MGNTGKNEDYVGKLVPNSECGKLLILQYNPSYGDHESWLSVAAECAKNDHSVASPSYFTVAKEKIENGKSAGLRAVAYWKGNQADKMHDIIVNNKMI